MKLLNKSLKNPQKPRKKAKINKKRKNLKNRQKQRLRRRKFKISQFMKNGRNERKKRKNTSIWKWKGGQPWFLHVVILSLRITSKLGRCIPPNTPPNPRTVYSVSLVSKISATLALSIPQYSAWAASSHWLTTFWTSFM